jgi:hypothetical protein
MSLEFHTLSCIVVRESSVEMEQREHLPQHPTGGFAQSPRHCWRLQLSHSLSVGSTVRPSFLSVAFIRSWRLQRGPLPDGIFPEPVPELVPVPAPRCCELSQSFCAAASAVLSAVPDLMCAQSFGRGIVELGRSRVVRSCFD